jgi:hypothetical protein
MWELRDWNKVLYYGHDVVALEAAVLNIPSTACWPNEICDLEAPSGCVLSIGIAKAGTVENPDIGSDLCCVMFQSESENPTHLSVVGDSSLDFENGGVVAFRYENGEWTEILRRNCVCRTTMTKILRDFTSTGRIPKWIEWEVD